MENTMNLDLMRRLVEDIGPRWCGQGPEGNRRTAELISRVLQKAGFSSQQGRGGGASVEIRDFPFVGWRPLEMPHLEILGSSPRTVPVAPMEYSGFASQPGLEGVLRYAGKAHMVPGFLDWPQYGLYSDKGALLALLIGHEGLSGWDAPPIPLHNAEPVYPYPMAMLGQSDHRRLHDTINAGETIRARFSGGGEPALLRGHNVVARIEGSIPDTIVFSAHIDTSYASPGANNNAGSVQVLTSLALRLAERLENWQGPSVEFLFCDATEWHYLGSKHFLYHREMEPEAPPIIANINIDSITEGSEALFVNSDDWMHRHIEQVIEGLRLNHRFSKITMLGAVAGSDHHSFISAGIHATEVLFWPCLSYKTPDDDMSGVDKTRMNDAMEIAEHLFHSLSKTIMKEKELS